MDRIVNYEVQIGNVENGFIVRVGCKVFVFNDWNVLYKELDAYFTGRDTELNRKFKGGDPQTGRAEAMDRPIMESTRGAAVGGPTLGY